MEMLLWILLLLLFTVIFGKWILLLLLTPVIRLVNRHWREIFFQRKREEKSAGTDAAPAAQPVSRPLPVREGMRYLTGFMRYMDFQIGRIPSHHVRRWLLRHVYLTDIKDHAVVYWGSEIRCHSRLSVGAHSVIGDRALLDARNGISIGENVNLSSNVSIYTEQHDHEDPDFKSTSDTHYGVRIDDRAWLGPNTIVLPRVHIGEGAVVAAGAVVTKDVEPFTIVAGIPARPVGKRNTGLRYTLGKSYTPFY